MPASRKSVPALSVIVPRKFVLLLALSLRKRVPPPVFVMPPMPEIKPPLKYVEALLPPTVSVTPCGPVELVTMALVLSVSAPVPARPPTAKALLETDWSKATVVPVPPMKSVLFCKAAEFAKTSLPAEAVVMPVNVLEPPRTSDPAPTFVMP